MTSSVCPQFNIIAHLALCGLTTPRTPHKDGKGSKKEEREAETGEESDIEWVLDKEKPLSFLVSPAQPSSIAVTMEGHVLSPNMTALTCLSIRNILRSGILGYIWGEGAQKHIHCCLP